MSKLGITFSSWKQKNTAATSPILTKFRKLQYEEETEKCLDGKRQRSKTVENVPELYTKLKKPRRSLSFCSLIHLPNRTGKWKISKQERRERYLTKEIDAMEIGTKNKNCEHFSDYFSQKRKPLEDIDETNCAMKRLSVVVDEIEKFEREFVVPMNKSVSSFNISEGLVKRQLKSKHKLSTDVIKFSSLDSVESSKFSKIRKCYSSSDSVISEYDSGAYSRESTPDFSLKSSITDASEPLVSPGLVINTSKKIEDPSSVSQTISGDQTDQVQEADEDNEAEDFDRYSKYPLRDSRQKNKDKLFSSTPILHKRPILCKSKSLLWTKTPIILKRSTTSVGFSRSLPVSISSVRCTIDCMSQVTVNGLCYHQ